MRENWAYLVPYIAVLTAFQVGLTGVTKLLGLAAYRKVQRFATAADAATGITSCGFAMLMFVVATKPLTPADTVRSDNPTDLLRALVTGYLVSFIVVLILTLLIAFGNPVVRRCAVLIGIVSFCISAQAIFDVQIKPSEQQTVWGLIIAAPVGLSVFLLRSPILAWLEPIDDSPTDAHSETLT
ncbi:hypothetical protein [Rhodococcus qingshengii]|uniref:hypothetical protein n=1 Tax=Rhodococcus qingshengii TaxID=334542 RepID=UPI00237D1E1C|nr:hypothetical protein [Rhodococcus qingshengii]WCT06164.1 hypothetical protein PI247_31085 [Rhodococcus qingshengii]